MNAADDLRAQIQQGRSLRLDWLGESASIASIAVILAAMANAQGGALVIGMTGPSGTLTGVRTPDSAIDRVIQAALLIEPPLIIPLPRAVRWDDKTIVVAQIPAGMPHVYSHDGRYLQRQDTDNPALKPRELRRLILERGDVSFEMELARGASMEDLDWDAAKAYVASLGSAVESNVENALLRRGCLTRQDGRVRPTNAGMLLFGKDPQRHIRSAEITAARFAGETMSDSFQRQDIGGTLPDQIRKVETFLRDFLRKGVTLGKTMARAEHFEYPLEAARELLVNAVAHRDYSVSGDGIRLFIYRDRMEVISPGGLPGPVTIANIKDERFSRNPAIVQVLSDMRFIERLGYGVDRVIDLMHEQRMRAPEFTETAGGFRVTLYNHTQTPTAPDGAPDEPPRLNGVYHGTAINPRQEEALIYLQTHSRITNSHLQTLCPDVHPETIRRDLSDLVAKSILRKMGEKRGSYYVLPDAPPTAL